MPRELFLEVIVALKATSETINGLTSLSDPKPHGVNCSSKSSHVLLLLWIDRKRKDLGFIPVMLAWSLGEEEGKGGC